MALPAQVRKILDEADECIRVLDTVREIPLPPSIKIALAEEWVLEVAALQITRDDAYPLDLRPKDRTRVIPMRKALAIIEGFEDDLLGSEIVSPAGIIGGKLRFAWNAGKFIVSHARIIWDIIVALLSELVGEFGAGTLDIGALLAKFSLQVMATIVAFMAAIAGLWLAAVNLPGVSKDSRSILRVATSACLKARKAALPQRTGKRVYRRKESRL